MSCPNGSQKKSGIPDYEWLSITDELCALYGEDSWMCQLSKLNLAGYIKNNLVDVNALCSSPPPEVDSLTPEDFLGGVTGGWLDKAIQISQGSKWNDWCECTPTPPTFNNGQCPVPYTVTATWTSNFQNEGEIPHNSTFHIYGPISAIQLENPGPNGACGLFVYGCNFQGLPAIANDSLGYYPAEIASNLVVTGVTPADGQPDNCGNAPSPPPPPSPASPTPPTPPPSLTAISLPAATPECDCPSNDDQGDGSSQGNNSGSGNQNVNFVNISVPIFSGKCDSSGNPVFTTQTVAVIAGTESSELLKFQEMSQIQGNSICSCNVSSTPDSWLIRPEYHRSQVIYQFAEVDNSGTIIGSPKYQITVPHHLPAKPTAALPNYKRGNWETIFVLNDNSKVTIHSVDAANGNLMLNAIKSRIDPTQLTNAYLSKSSLVVTNTPIAEINVKNRMAKYYSTGAKNEVPDWLVKW